MRRTQFPIALAIAFVCLMTVANAQDQTPPIGPQPAPGPLSNARKLAAELVQATIDDDPEKVTDLTFAGLVRFVGGREEYIRMQREGRELTRRGGIEYQSGKLGEPGPLVKEGPRQFVILPLDIILAGKDAQRIRVPTYLLGISSDEGKTWTFVNGDVLGNEEQRRLIFPTLPSELKLPRPQPIERLNGPREGSGNDK